VLIVGAGFYGATMARRLHEAGIDVAVIDRRDHVAGNAFTRWDEETECHEHVYGAHIFHTNNEEVWRFVKRFANFYPYRHVVRVLAGGRLYPFPINLMTLHQVFGATTPEDARYAMEADSTPCDEIMNMEQHCRHYIGNRLYELFIEGYTTKQWGCEPRALPSSIIKRIPVRLTHEDSYFSDRWQGIPVGGYTALVENMLKDIPVELNIDFKDDADRWITDHDLVVYTGGIDEFFKQRNGALGYRSLRFVRSVEVADDAQGCAVLNYCDVTTPWTRTIEHRHFMVGKDPCGRTLISIEHPSDEGEPFYPINTGQNMTLLATYRKLAAEHFPTVIFGGRLGEYRYLDMHQVIASALARSRDILERLR
jgi:UDP-galactopyranose mutase